MMNVLITFSVSWDIRLSVKNPATFAITCPIEDSFILLQALDSISVTQQNNRLDRAVAGARFFSPAVDCNKTKKNKKQHSFLLEGFFMKDS